MKTFRRWGLAAAVAALSLAGLAPPASAEPLPGGTLDVTKVPKYQAPLVVPPAMPANEVDGSVDYSIAVRQFQQQILPEGLPRTTVWSYGSIEKPGTAAEGGSFHYPAFTIEAKAGEPVTVRWINDLVDRKGNYLPHLLPIDPTLHWANPPGGEQGRDSRPTFTSTPGPYTGPVPIVVHLHGAHAAEESDGYPEAWYLPAAANIPAGYATDGTWYQTFKAKAEGAGPSWAKGTAVFRYGNDQPATTLWFHDHTLGMTRANVYAGPAGFYLLRGGAYDVPAGTLPEGPFEIPIVIQDRSFNKNGSLFYPASREFFDGFAGPYVPGADGFPSDISPMWNPEFFGNAIVVNGRTWPYLEVEQRRYRFRFLNGSNSRFLILRTDFPLAFWQIGADGGFLPRPEERTELLLGPAERADTIVDFSAVPPGTTITLLNVGPDEPFGGGTPFFGCADDPSAPEDCFEPADPGTTGQVMQFVVTAATVGDTSVQPGLLALPAPPAQPKPKIARQVSLNELDSASVCLAADEATPVPCTDPAAVFPFGPLEAMLGTVQFRKGVPMGMPMMWSEPITETPKLGPSGSVTETWEIYNFTEDAHPIHIHQTQFQIVNRQVIGERKARAPDAGESGRKDTVIAYPGEITRVTATFDKAGLFVWHCHILEHEDNEMMRPFRVVP